MEVSKEKIDKLEKEINFLREALQVNQEILSKAQEINYMLLGALKKSLKKEKEEVGQMVRNNRQAMPWKLKQKRTLAFKGSQGLMVKELYVGGKKIAQKYLLIAAKHAI